MNYPFIMNNIVLLYLINNNSFYLMNFKKIILYLLIPIKKRKI